MSGGNLALIHNIFEIDHKIEIEPNYTTYNPCKREYRTHNKAGKVVDMPDKYAIISNANYKDAITLIENKKAHIQAIKEDKRVHIKDGIICLDGLAATSAEIIELGTNDYIEDLDFALLRVLYSIILNNFEESIKNNKMVPQITTIYVPDLLTFLGKEKTSRNEIVSLIKNIIRFHSLVGIINCDILPVMIYMGERQETNTISFSSPYLIRVIEETYKDSIIVDGKGKPIMNNNGIPKTKASHSYLIKPSIRNERNKRAIEIVHCVVLLIERAGNHTPHIKAQTIIEQNPLLMYALEGISISHKNQILQRCFKKAWQLLKTQTYLEEKYKDIQLPDAEDPSYIPNMSKLDMVFRFQHKGKCGEND